MNLSSPSTVSGLLKRHSLHPRKRFGQNFLVDGNTLAKIVSAGGIGEGDQVLEIGAGLGVLTQSLAETVGISGRVVSVEIDRDLLPVLADTVGSYPQVKIISSDVLALSFPEFFNQNFTDASVHIIANIPYNITTPLLTSLVDYRTGIKVIVFLVQKEVAQRLVAGAATSDYGALSVFAQYHSKVEIMGIVPRRVFLPAPDVDSAIIRLTLYSSKPVQAENEKLFFEVVKAAFGQRRKALPNALSGDPSLGWSREKAAERLSAAGIDPMRRGETLTIEEFARLAGA
jgi:16S rRNA (adenine1518-N6/adenine1519-N6)-dimethyltransferase